MRNREMESAGMAAIQAGMPTSAVGARVVEAVRDNDLFVLTHPEYKPIVEARLAAIMAAFDKSAAAPQSSPFLRARSRTLC
jgi:hypothetical protein